MKARKAVKKLLASVEEIIKDQKNAAMLPLSEIIERDLRVHRQLGKIFMMSPASVDSRFPKWVVRNAIELAEMTEEQFMEQVKREQASEAEKRV
jgi:hypothetical protein